MPSLSDLASWHQANVGLTGRSSDPSVCLRTARLLLPVDSETWALAYLKGQKIGGKLKIPSVCALYGMAAFRYVLGTYAPAILSLTYCKGPNKGVRDAMVDLQDAASAVGLLDTNPSGLPKPGDVDIIDDGSGLRAHVIASYGIDDATSAVLSVDGGQVDNSYILNRRRLVVSPPNDRRFWYVDEATPYLKNGNPNGRFLIRRVRLSENLSP